MAFPAQEQARQPGIESLMRPPPDYAPRYRGSGRMRDKTVLISGGDSGIGRAVSVLLAREGAKLAIIYLEEDGDAADTQRLIEAEGSEALLLRGDVTDPSICWRFVEQTLSRFDRIDVLINHAAEQHPVDRVEDIDPAILARTFATNVFGYFFLTQAVRPHLRRGAAIINTTSVTAYRGSEHLVDYAATRGAIVSFTRSLATQLVADGIRVNGVAPGPIWTPLIPSSFSAKQVESFGEKTPMKRAGQPNEVAPCYLFLACDDSSYMTGQALHPDGGDAPYS